MCLGYQWFLQCHCHLSALLFKQMVWTLEAVSVLAAFSVISNTPAMYSPESQVHWILLTDTRPAKCEQNTNVRWTCISHVSLLTSCSFVLWMSLAKHKFKDKITKNCKIRKTGHSTKPAALLAGGGSGGLCGNLSGSTWGNPVLGKSYVSFSWPFTQLLLSSWVSTRVASPGHLTPFREESQPFIW